MNRKKVRKGNSGLSPLKRNHVVTEMNKLNRSKVYRNKKHTLRANDADKQIKDYYNGRL